MSDLLGSLKADLLSRRMLPLLVLAALALVGAAGYAFLGGSPSSTATPASGARGAVSASVPPVEGPGVSAALANPHAALAETTSGGYYQHGGKIHNPFKPLPSSEPSGASASSTATVGGGNGSAGGAGSSSGSGSSGGSGNSGGSGSGEGSTSAGEAGEGSSGPSKPSASETGEGMPQTSMIYTVSATMTKLDEEEKPVGTPQTFAEMVPVKEMPSKKKPLLAFLGVSKDGTKAVFVLLQPAILHGDAKCVPSPSNCEGIELTAQHSEELQYLEADGSVVAYELKVTKLSKSSVTAAKAAKAVRGDGGKKDAELLSKLHLSYAAALLTAAASQASGNVTPAASTGSSVVAPAQSSSSASPAPERSTGSSSAAPE